jgi:hypothetical protein
MKKIILYTTLWFLLINCSAHKEEATEINLNNILEEYSADYYALNPLLATANGINDYNDQLSITIGDAHIEESIALNNKYLDTLKTIDYDRLTHNEKIKLRPTKI